MLTSRRTSQLPTLGRALCLLNVEAASVGLAVAHLRLGEALRAYVEQNTIAADARSKLILTVALAMGLVSLITLLCLVRGATPARLESVARRISPLVVAPTIPLLTNWAIWESQPLPFLLFTLTACFLFRQTLIIASDEPALFGERGSLRALAVATEAAAPRLSAALPLLIVLAGALAYAVYFSVITVRAHWDGVTSTYDLGIEQNILWNTTHFSSPLFKCSPLRGPTGGHFSLHATFIAFAMAPVYALYPRAETLLVMQAVLLGAGAVPLFIFARERIRAWPACLLSICYLLYAPLHGSNLYHFHYLTIAPPFILAVAASLQARRYVWMAVFTVLALSVREDIGLGLAAMGAYFLLSGERPLPGLFLALGSLAFSVIMKTVLMPPEGGGASFLYMYEGIIPAGEKGAGGILKTVMGNPGYLAHTLATGDRLVYALQILVPVLLLPLRRPLTLLMLISGFAFTLLTGRTAMANSLAPIMISFQYTAHFTPYLFVGTAIAFGSMTGEADGKFGRSAVLSATVAAVVAATLLTSYQFGAVLQTNTALGAFQKFHFKSTPRDLQRRVARAKVLAVVPPNARVATSECLVPHVSNRANAYNFGGNPFDAEYVVVDYGPCSPDTRPTLQMLGNARFGVVAFEPPYIALKRGAPREQNVAVIRSVLAGSDLTLP